MKKLISLVLLITFTLALSGCGEERASDIYIDGATNVQYDEDHDTWFLCVRTDNGQNLDCDVMYTRNEVNEIYYTEEEVDDLLNTLCEDIFSRDYEDCITAHKDVQSIFEELDTELYTMRERTSKLNERVLELESMLRDFERFEYEDLLEWMLYMEEDFGDELEEYIDERLEELELEEDEPLTPMYTEWVNDQLVFTLTEEPYSIVLTVDKVFIDLLEIPNLYDVVSVTVCGDICETEYTTGSTERYTGDEIIQELRDWMEQLQLFKDFR